jgi:hypothetical protein
MKQRLIIIFSTFLPNNDMPVYQTATRGICRVRLDRSPVVHRHADCQVYPYVCEALEEYDSTKVLLIVVNR